MEPIIFGQPVEGFEWDLESEGVKRSPERQFRSSKLPLVHSFGICRAPSRQSLMEGKLEDIMLTAYVCSLAVYANADPLFQVKIVRLDACRAPDGGTQCFHIGSSADTWDAASEDSARRC